MKPIEEHLADFLLTCSGPGMLDYRRRCLALWATAYGPVTASRVEAMVTQRYKRSASSSQGRPSEKGARSSPGAETS